MKYIDKIVSWGNKTVLRGLTMGDIIAKYVKIYDKNGDIMQLITSDHPTLTSPMAAMLDGYDCPAILVSADYEILATNTRYQESFGEIDFSQEQSLFPGIPWLQCAL